ncbi:rCG43371 [Rattus norvegicus]|uniref:RCG43371 n=1 Tax=Rattus norvegicus TaxID=10116 RepID=A6IWC6_RAT|nr:rCG43371 [Rattus norvegicus]
MLAQGTLLVSRVKTRRERIQQQRWTGPKALTVGLCAQEADMEVKLCTAKPQDDIMPHHHDTGPDRTPECRELYKHSETFREHHKNKGKEWGGGVCCILLSGKLCRHSWNLSYLFCNGKC